MNIPTPTSKAAALVREQGPFRALQVAKASGDQEVVQVLERTIDQARVLSTGGEV
jgi:hypothetical protein